MNSESLATYSKEQWTCIHKFENVLSLENIKSVKMVETYYNKLIFIVDNEYVLSKSRFLMEQSSHVFNDSTPVGQHMNWAHEEFTG